ncbi:MAG: AGE family epimerase/isomerase [Clostridia bacterium]|nr:AGE family epimerase/isomerase [Clostridia bacterium]
MDRNKLIETQKWIKEQLETSVNFWLENGMDKEHGGVYTCLDRKGEVYSTDKSVWMQGRCGWTFSYLCNMYGAKKEWLDAAKSCIDFMEKYCINRNAGRRMYFTVTEDGKPLRQRRYCFSEGFYAMANAEYYLATGDEECIKRAREAYELIWNLNNGLITDPAGLGPKTIPETRSGRALADPMIYLNISAVMRRCDPENAKLYNERSRACAEDIFTYFRKEEMRCTLESVAKDGTPELDYTAGRTVNPGHDIECAWFVMQEALYQGNDELYKKAVSMFDDAYNMGWDNVYGGLLYFIDCLGKPVEAYEHDMKLWWPHNELLIASMMIFRDTKDSEYLDIFYKTLDYCKQVFADGEYGEWYGYLRRDGLPTEPTTKGSTFKGPFHLPRCLIMVDKMIDDVLKDE